jgi:hypothetical protein
VTDSAAADADGEDVDTETKRVTTYLPQYQADLWDDHADDLGMSRAEFVRTMVQTGRRGFLTGPEADETAAPGEGDAGDRDLPTIVRARVLAALRAVDAVRRDELQEILTEDVTQALDAVLDDLQTENAVLRRRDGFELVADPEADDE